MYAEIINKLKKQKNAVILAHYYQTGDILEIADIIGDSYDLSSKAKQTDADIIVFCGVRFMAESAKILNPGKKVLLPSAGAGCPMAGMVTADDVKMLRRKYPDAAVACYVNSTYQVKAQCDVCVTSSNAVKIISALDEKRIVFLPDQNLARYIARHVPEKEIIPYDGYCIVHHRTNKADVKKARDAYPGALLLAHPECPKDVTDSADFVGSTSQIISYAQQSNTNKFIIGTEEGIIYTLKKLNPGKQFNLLSSKLVCANMKKTKIEDVVNALKFERHEIILDEKIMDKARASLERMLDMA